jgi:hypothetical protein
MDRCTDNSGGQFAFCCQVNSSFSNDRSKKFIGRRSNRIGRPQSKYNVDLKYNQTAAFGSCLGSLFFAAWH